MKRLKVLLIGTGTVGEAIAKVARDEPWLERLVLSDYDLERAQAVRANLGAAPGDAEDRFPVERIDAGDVGAMAALARRHAVDVILNAADPRFVIPVMDAALAAGADYVDMATSLSAPHPGDPYARPGKLLAADQFARHEEFRSAGRLALLGMGMDPGLTDVFAKFAAQELFDTIDEVHVRDGGDLRIEGPAFAPVFSIWTTIEECLNPPLVWDRDQGGHLTTQPFSAPEAFEFPEGIGPVECVNVEHEEVVFVPRELDVRRVTFKYALGTDFIAVLRSLHRLGLDSTTPVRVGDVEVAPRDVVAAVTPDPAGQGRQMKGRAIVGSWVIGRKDGRPREVYLYQKTIAERVWQELGLQAVGWQTGFNPVIALGLLADGTWSGAGVLPPEAFDARPYLASLTSHGIHWAIDERTPGATRPV